DRIVVAGVAKLKAGDKIREAKEPGATTNTPSGATPSSSSNNTSKAEGK
ncbi:MAG: hypothetical protein RIR10_2042, partial [Planctomycetota bacterium]